MKTLNELPEVKEYADDMGFPSVEHMIRDHKLSRDTLYFSKDPEEIDIEEWYWYCGPLVDEDALEDTVRTDDYLEGLVKELKLTDSEVEIGASENQHIYYGTKFQVKVRHAIMRNRIKQDFKLYEE